MSDRSAACKNINLHFKSDMNQADEKMHEKLLRKRSMT